MKIKIIGGQFDMWAPFALEVYDNKFVVINTRDTAGIKLYLRTINPPSVGVSSVNKIGKVLYIPFYMNEWKIEVK